MDLPSGSRSEVVTIFFEVSFAMRESISCLSRFGVCFQVAVLQISEQAFAVGVMRV